jgi:hypothetical protein
MPGRGPLTFKKRQREQQQKEKQAEKLARRLERKEKPSSDEDEVLDSPTEETPDTPEP